MYARKQALTAAVGIMLSICSMQSAVADADISSFAFVQQDGSLKVSGYHIHLYGISIPPTAESCYMFIRPALCGPRGAIALEFKISGNFIHCTPSATYPDGSMIASCRLNGEDLSAWMLQKGWAVALPDAPFAYQTLQKIAQAQGVGIWGIPLESIPRPHGHPR